MSPKPYITCIHNSSLQITRLSSPHLSEWSRCKKCYNIVCSMTTKKLLVIYTIDPLQWERLSDDHIRDTINLFLSIYCSIYHFTNKKADQSIHWWSCWWAIILWPTNSWHGQSLFGQKILLHLIQHLLITLRIFGSPLGKKTIWGLTAYVMFTHGNQGSTIPFLNRKFTFLQFCSTALFHKT